MAHSLCSKIRPNCSHHHPHYVTHSELSFYLQAGRSQDRQGWQRRKTHFSVPSAELSWAFSRDPSVQQTYSSSLTVRSCSWERIPRDAANSVFSSFFSLMRASASRCDPTWLSLENYPIGEKETQLFGTCRPVTSLWFQRHLGSASHHQDYEMYETRIRSTSSQLNCSALMGRVSFLQLVSHLLSKGCHPPPHLPGGTLHATCTPMRLTWQRVEAPKTVLLEMCSGECFLSGPG